MKPKLLSATNHYGMLSIGCDYGVCFFSIPKAIIVTKWVDQEN